MLKKLSAVSKILTKSALKAKIGKSKNKLLDDSKRFTNTISNTKIQEVEIKISDISK